MINFHTLRPAAQQVDGLPVSLPNLTANLPSARRFLLLAVFFWATSGLFSQTTWNGSASTDWFTAANWSAGVPTAATDAIIPGGVPNNPSIGVAGAVAKSVAVQVTGSLNIFAAGTLGIDGSTSNAIDNSGTVQNRGAITIGATTGPVNNGILNNGMISNLAGGTINIDRSTINGLLNEAGGTFTNGGAINIGAVASAGDHGLLNTATFNNNTGGVIKIDRTIFDGLWNGTGGTFTNGGAITIGAVASVGGYGLLNFATFNNNTGGQINTDRASTSGLHNFFTGTFTNAGTITSGGVASPGGAGVSNLGMFNNNAGGQINADRSTGYGLYNAEGTFNNSGAITVGAVASPGTGGIINQAVFNNNPGGTIYVDRSTTIGIDQDFVAPFFTNAGVITLGAVVGVGPTAMNIKLGTFNNSVCSAVVNIVSNSVVLTTGSGSFLNAGLITENASGNSNISSNSGMVQNLNGGTFTIGSNTGTLTTCASPQNACFPIGYGVAPSAACMQAFCIGDNPTVGSLAPNGAGFMWYSSATSTTPLPASTVLVNGGVYFVSQIVAGCETMRARVNVVVTTPAPGKVCIGGCSN